MTQRPVGGLLEGSQIGSLLPGPTRGPGVRHRIDVKTPRQGACTR